MKNVETTESPLFQEPDNKTIIKIKLQLSCRVISQFQNSSKKQFQ